MNRSIIIWMIVILFSCNIGTTTDELEKPIIPMELYRSSENSFQKDFYLQLGNKHFNIYGWETTNEGDTLYYKSNGEIEYDSAGRIHINCKNFEVSDVKVLVENLKDFKANTDLSLPLLGGYSGFFGNKNADGSLTFLAVKPSYGGRADRFNFERIK